MRSLKHEETLINNNNNSIAIENLAFLQLSHAPPSKIRQVYIPRYYRQTAIVVLIFSLTIQRTTTNYTMPLYC